MNKNFASAPSPTTQTRNFLLQPDILHCILDHLDVPQGRTEQAKEIRRALVALAQTCHALSDPALDCLWRTLDSLKPLVRCYTAVWNEDRENVPSPTDWVIIRRYSHRIKELAFFPLDQVSFCWLQAIGLQPILLFPNLRLLFWNSPTEVHCPTSLSITLLQGFLGPSLVSLHFFSFGMDVSAFQALQALSTNLLCSNLKTLAIAISVSEPGSFGSLSLPSHLCDSLECLHLPVPIDDAVLRHIIMSPKLKELSLTLDLDQPRLHQVRLPSDITPLHNVDTLFLDVWDLQLVTSLLRNEGQIFHSFALSLRSRPTIPAFSAFLTALLSRQRIYSLRSIALQSHYSESDLSTHTPLYDMLRPLTCLSHLGQLFIHLNDCFPIDDDELASLARHWPHLWDLGLPASPVLRGHPWESGKYITLKGLVSLVECCPQLQWLYLPLDPREVPADIPKRSAVVPALMAIQFSDSPINDPQLVADFLARHFPSLRSVSCMFKSPGGDDEEILLYETAWGQVKTRIEEL